MVPNRRGTKCDSVRRCAHRLGSPGHRLQRATTAARLSPVTPSRSLCRANACKVLYCPLSPGDGLGPTPRVLLLPPPSLPPLRPGSRRPRAAGSLAPSSGRYARAGGLCRGG